MTIVLFLLLSGLVGWCISSTIRSEFGPLAVVTDIRVFVMVAAPGAAYYLGSIHS